MNELERRLYCMTRAACEIDSCVMKVYRDLLPYWDLMPRGDEEVMEYTPAAGLGIGKIPRTDFSVCVMTIDEYYEKHKDEYIEVVKKLEKEMKE